MYRCLYMYDTFRNMVNDIFNNPDFTEFCYINGIKYTCLVSPVTNDIAFTEAGLEDLVNFYIEVQLVDQNKNNLPKENDRVKFRNKQYKISHVDIDSALSTLRLYLISNSRGI